MSMIAGYLPPQRAASPLVQARKIAPFSQEDMNHITQTVAELSKEMPRILCTNLLTKCLTLLAGGQTLLNHVRES